MPRRSLQFDRMEQIMEDVDRLHTAGYTAHGKWDLSQICEHLADWMSFPLDGFPRTPIAIGILLSLVRTFRGRMLLDQILQSGTMKSNAPTVQTTVHGTNPDARAATERLRSTIQRVMDHQDRIHPSPLFGEMTKDELIGLQLAHCAHHLSFLEPKG